MEDSFQGRLADKLSGLGITHSASSINRSYNNSDGLAQVMKAVEAAETTIRHQIDENIQLRAELENKILELEKYKEYGSVALKKHASSAQDDRFYGAYEVHRPALAVGNPEDSARKIGDTILRDHAGTIITDDLMPNSDGVARQSREEIPSVISKINGRLEAITGPQLSAENSGISRISSPSTTSLSTDRYQTERESDRQFNHHGHGLMQMSEVDSSVNPHKQDLVQKVQEQEQEIVQLKRHLADYSVKEAHICNEKYVLDKRIAYMHLAFDQQQQDLVDTVSKALSYRQDIMEENIRLSYQLQAAQQERLMFVSSLLPLLSEYSLQPPVPDAQSIVSNVKGLFKHLQEKLNLTENKNGLELVPQQMISHGDVTISSSDAHATAVWDLLNQHRTAPIAESINMNHDDSRLHSSLASR